MLPGQSPRDDKTTRVFVCTVRRVRHRGLSLSVPVALLAIVLTAGCTSSTGSPGSEPSKGGSTTPNTSAAAGVQVVHVQGNDALQFAPSSVAVKPGRVRLVFTVVGKTPQTFTSKALKADSGNVPAGKSVTLELIVPGPGKYSFYSAYHKAQGMTGTIVAKR